MKRRIFIQAIIASFGGTAIASTNVQKLEPEKVLLLKAELAGFQFYAGHKVFHQLEIKTPLTLKRETQNNFDSNAVEIYWQDQKLGYIPRKANITIAQMLDRGEILNAQIKRLQYSDDPWKRVELDVYWVGENRHSVIENHALL